jgi:hypothetical protein
MLIGVAADFMLTYLLLGLALAWALRRSAVGLAAALAGICATLLPAYALIGTAIFHSLAKRQGKVSADTFYQLISATYRHTLPHSVSLLVGLAFVVLAMLLLWRLPDAVPGLPAIMPALAISIAWLFIWYYQLPWYDTMAVGALAIYPASRLDWVVTGQLTAGPIAMMPGTTATLHPHWLARLDYLVTFRLMPAVLFLTLVALVWLCLSRGWGIAQRPAASTPDVPSLERAAATDRLGPRLARPAA